MNQLRHQLGMNQPVKPGVVLMKTRQNNSVTNCIDAIYAKNDI